MIKQLNDLVKSHDLPETPIKNMIERMHIERLTPLQKTAFNKEAFWDNDKNLLIQGATSSGKTLVSEILALHCMKQQKQVIYLAPLRAMVAEKCDNFKKDFATFSDSIYASSSDYQMNDESITKGLYDMAVIVYEKFFSILTEESIKSGMMTECKLIIVDELQMLSTDQRGPKLEFALAKVLQSRPDIRIVGLTTCYSDVSDLIPWLNPVELIINNERMLPMMEHIVCSKDNRYISKYNPAIEEHYEEHGLDRNHIQSLYEERYREGKNHWETLPCIEPCGTDPRKEKINTLRVILKKELKERGKTCKIIIFTHSKRNTYTLATNITDLFERRDLNRDLVTELNNLDDEEDIRDMRDRLFTYGVAFHHSSLSTEARQLIENEFSKADGILNVIVATETLAIGVNLPADVIVVYDNAIMRTKKEERLEAQAYKNYIGRAGRLGISNTEAASYLIASTKNQMIAFCERYIEAKPSKITSSYSNNTTEYQAPFVLNGLPGQTFSEQDMKKILMHTIYSEKNIACASDILHKLEEYKLVRSAKGMMFIGPGAGTSYNRTVIGVALAPFALSIEACWIIRCGFYKGDGYTNGALPDTYTETDLKDGRYILDILYLVCMTPEVVHLNAPLLPGNANINQEQYIKTRNSVKSYLAKRKSEDPDMLWEHSLIETTFFEDEFDLDNVRAIIKAILMELWIKGKTIEEIRKETKFSFKVNIGDLDHLGDVVSYLVEAISKVVDYNDIDNQRKLMRPFYQLSRRIRYGADNDMVRILNCHVRGIGRYKVIRLARELNKKYVDLLDFFRHASDVELAEYHFTQKQRDELCKELDRKYSLGSTVRRVEELYYDGLITQHFVDSYNIYSVNENNENLFKMLRTAGIEVTPLRIMGYTDLIYTIAFGLHQVLLFILSSKKKENESCSASKILEYQNVIKVLNQKIVFISFDNFSTDVIDLAMMKPEKIFITRRTFVNLLISSLNYRRKNTYDSVFFKVLEDYKGILDEHSVNKIMSDYDKQQEKPQRRKDVFLSYARGLPEENSIVSEVAKFAQLLNQKEISYFFDTVSIEKGENFVKKLDHGLSTAKVFILFVDTRYGKTDWSQEEMYSAIKSQIEKQRLVIPMIFDEEGRQFWESKALPSVINYQNCIDPGQRDVKYQETIEQIIKHLNAL